MPPTVPASVAFLTAALTAATPVSAKVIGNSPLGFVIEHAATIALPQDAAQSRFNQLADWWDSDHTWGGDAARLSIDPRPGGCWCEALPDGGGVQHMRVVFAGPGEMRFEGGLGPLQTMGATGTMQVSFEETRADPAQTSVTLRYQVFGIGADGSGLASMAGPVDRVLEAALARYTDVTVSTNTDEPR